MGQAFWDDETLPEEEVGREREMTGVGRESGSDYVSMKKGLCGESVETGTCNPTYDICH